MAHEPYIIIPDNSHEAMSSKATHHEKEVRDATAWHRPGKAPVEKLPGRTLKIENTPVVLPSGQMKKFSPMQVAIMALPSAVENGYDNVRIISPIDKDTPGDAAERDKWYKVPWLIEVARRVKDDPAFLPKVERGEIQMEDSTVGSSPLPRRWKMNDAGIFAPSS
jgi:hypothetical protein